MLRIWARRLRSSLWKGGDNTYKPFRVIFSQILMDYKPETTETTKPYREKDN